MLWINANFILEVLGNMIGRLEKSRMSQISILLENCLICVLFSRFMRVHLTLQPTVKKEKIQP